MKPTKFPTSLHYFFSTQSLQIFQTYFDNTKNIYRQSFLGFVESSYILFPSPSIREFSGWPTFKAEFLRHQAKHPEEKIAACWILRFTLILVIDRYLEYVHFFLFILWVRWDLIYEPWVKEFNSVSVMYVYMKLKFYSTTQEINIS